MLRFCVRLLTCVLIFACLHPAFAQVARISGQVTDPQGAGIPGAGVVAINQQTFNKLSATTDGTGQYMLPFLPAGPYKVEVQANGFSTSESNVLKVAVGQAFLYNVQLTVGSTQTNVEVNAGNSELTQVNTENAEVSGTITGKEVVGLQLNGRNFSQLIALAPGVSNQTSQDEARVGMAGSVSYSVNGGRVEYNSFQVDGSEILNVGINKDHTALIVTPSIDAIQDVKVLTSNYGAKYPSAGNGTTIITTKSGTDEYHGSLYEFLRNEAFNAKGYFDVTNGAPLYRRNDSGGTVGGPLTIPRFYDAKGKTHFFFSEEVRMETDPYAYHQAVPSLAERNGDFSDVCPGTDCPRGVNTNTFLPVSPIATALLNTGVIPAPNSHTGCASSINSCYLAEISLPTFYREELLRVDHSLTNTQYLTFRYIHDEWNETAPVPQYATVVNSFPTIRNNFEGPGTSVVAQWVSQLPSQWTNDATFSYTSSDLSLKDVAAPATTFNAPPSLYLPPSNSGLGLGYIFDNSTSGKIPGIVIGGSNQAYGGSGFSADPGYLPWKHTNPIYSAMDNAEKVFGKHTLKFGLQFIYFQRSQTNGPIGAATGDTQGLLTFNGTGTGNSFADFLMMGSGISSYQQDSGQGTYHQHYQILEPYIQDDWQVTRRLIVNAGVRVSLFGVFKEANHNAYNWEPRAYSQSLAESVYVSSGSGQLFNAATNTVVPIYAQNGQGKQIVNPVITNGIVQCGVNGVPDGCMTGHLWNPAPRIGFAWDAFGNGKMAVRGGYGIFFEHGTSDEANTGSLEGSAPLVLSMIQYNVPGAGCIGFVPSNCPPYPSGASRGMPGAFPLNVTAIPTKAVWPYVQQWSFSVERELPRGLLASLGYVGSKGTHLTLQREINQLIPTPSGANPYGSHEPILASDCVQGGYPLYVGGAYEIASGELIWPANPAYNNLAVACYELGYTASGQSTTSAATPNSYRTYAPGLGNIYSLENTANSTYNALQITLRRVAAPLTLGVAYTYSHSFDNSSDRSDSNFVNSYDVRGNRASSSFDQRHLLHINYIYDLPLRLFLQRLLSNLNTDPDPDRGTPVPPPSSFLHSTFSKALLDHWQLSGITLFETGTPFSVINGGDTANGVSALDNAGVFNGVGSGSYPDICPTYSTHIPSVASGSLGVGPLLRTPAEFCAPRGLTFGNAGRNVLRNPSRLNFDMAMEKHFTVMERAHIAFRAEAFNLFNHTQFRIYDPTLGNQANNTATCYASTAAAEYSAAGGGGTDCLTNSSFLHPVDAHRPRTLQFALKLDF